LEAELRGSRQDIEALKNAEQENKQSTSIASTGSDGEEIEKLLQLIIGVQHSTKQEGDVAEALHYLCDKVLGRTHHGQSLEFNTILEGSKNSAKLYVSGSEKMFIQGFSYRDLNEKLLAILYPPPPPKILFTFGDSEEWVVDESEAGTTGSTSSQSAPTAPPKSASSTQIQAAAKEGLNSLVFNKRKKGGTTSQASLFEQKAPGISSSDNASFTPDIAENATTHPSEPVSEIVPGHIGTFRAPISDSKDDAWTPYDEMASIVPDSNPWKVPEEEPQPEAPVSIEDNCSNSKDGRASKSTRGSWNNSNSGDKSAKSRGNRQGDGKSAKTKGRGGGNKAKQSGRGGGGSNRSKQQSGGGNVKVAPRANS